MKKVLFFLLLLIAGFGMKELSAQFVEVTIGTGTSSSCTSPFNALYKNSWNEAIYPASEFTTAGGQAGTITSIAYNVASSYTFALDQMKIYMGTTTRTSHSSTSNWQPMSELTLVYDHTNISVCTQTGWETFQLDNPFYYNGIDNLVIVVAKAAPNWSNSPTYYYTDVTSATMYRQSDSDPTGYTSHPGSNAGTTSSYRANIKLTVQTAPITCPRPTDLVISDVMPTEVTVSWTRGGTETSWDIYLATNSTLPDSNTVPTATATDTFYTLTNLDPATDYKVYVRADCGAGDYSIWNGAPFRSACDGEIHIPYVQDFEADGTGTGTMPRCWSVISTTTSSPYIYNSNHMVGDNSLYINNTSNDYSYIVLPAVEANYNVDQLMMSFYYARLGNNNETKLIVGVMSDTTDITTFEPVATLSPERNLYWETAEVYFDSYTGTGRNIAILSDGRHLLSNNSFCLDYLEVKPVTCRRPANVQITDVTSSSVTLEWLGNASMYEIAIDTIGYDVDSVQMSYITATTSPFTLQNLLPDNEYDLYVRGVCNGDNSDWSDRVRFKTACSDHTTLPIIYTFDADVNGGRPSCMTTMSNSYNNVPMVSRFSGETNKFLYFVTKSANAQYAVMSRLSTAITLSDLQMVFRGRTDNVGQRILIGVMTNPYDPTTFEQVDIFEPANTNTWEEHTTLFNGYTGAGEYIAFKFNNPVSSDYIFLIDTVVVDNIATCFVPHNLAVSNISGSSAYVTWDAGLQPLQTGYTLEYTEQGQSQWTPVTVTDNYYVLSGLTQGTTYDIRVKSNCASSNSDYVYKSFTTNCNAGGDLAIGNGTSTNKNFPACNYYNYALSEQLFSSTELGAANTFRSISFQCSTANAASRSWAIYLMPTTNTSLSGFVNADSTAKKVFEGTVNIAPGWFTIPFDTVFHYDGTSNLILIVDDNTGSYVTANYYYVHSNPNGSSYYDYQDGADYLPSSASSYSPSSNSYRNNVIFGGDCDNTATCVKPNIVVNNITDESADVQIVAGLTETSWTVDYKSVADTGWTSLGTITASDLPVLLTNLAANTEYTVRAQAQCSASQTSDWKTTSFTTECSLISQLPYSENFDSYTASGSGTYPDCWTMLSNYTSIHYPYLSTTSPASGTRCLYFYNYNTYYSTAVLPTIDATQIQINQTLLSFKAKKTSSTYSIKVGVMSDPNDFTTFEEVSTLTPQATDTWEQFYVPMSSYTGTGTHIAFASYSELGTISYMYVDDVVLDVLPNCLIPTSIVVNEATQSTIQLQWDGGGATNFEVVAVPAGSTLADEMAAGNSVMVFEDSVTLTGLTASISYTIYVRADCGVDYSDWGSITTRTAQIPATLPYFCDFESGDPGFDFVNGSATNQWAVGTATNNGGTHALYISDNNGTSNSYSISSTSNVWAYRDIEFPACPSGYTLSFDWNSYGESCCDYMMVFIGDVSVPAANNNTQPAGTTVLQPNYNSSYPERFNTASAYQTFTYTMPGSSTTSIKRLYFLWHNDGSVGTQPPASVDNISISPIYCPAPTNVATSNLTSDGATVTWTTPSTITNCVLYYRPDGDTTWTIENNASSPYILTGLTPSTRYTVRVASDCGTGNGTLSAFATTTFVTSCVPMTTIPYTQNFDSETGTTATNTNVLPICWSQINGGTNYSGLPTVYNSNSYAHSGSNSLYFYTYSSSDYADQYAVLPGIDPTQITLSSLQLTFSARSYSASYPFEIQVGVMSDPSVDSTFQPVQTITVNGTAYQHCEVYFSNFTGTGDYIAFKVAKPTSNYNYGFVDDVVLEEAPNCSPVLDLTVSNVAGTSALLSWTDGHFGTPASYTVEYSEAGQNNWMTASASVTGSPYMLSGLDQSTTYDVRVKVNCSDNSESAWTTTTFTTHCFAGGETAIGNGTSTNYYLPVNNYYHYTYSQQIFLASEMNGPSSITSVSFEYAYSSPMTSKTNVVIYLGHTQQSTFSSASNYIPATALTQVYSGSLNCQQGWNTFNFTTPFQYNGTDNLVLVVDDNSDDYNGSSYVFYTHSTGTNYRSLYFYSDSYNPAPSDPTSAGASSSYTSGNRSNVKFGGNCDSTVTCVAPNLYVTNVTSSSATVNWMPGYDETAWEMEYKENTDTIWTPVTITTTFAEVLTSLTPATAYNVRLRSDCGGDYSNWVSANFTTECDVFPIPFSQNFNNLGSGNNVFPMCWSRSDNYSSSAYPYVSTTDGGTLYFYATSSTYNIAVTPELSSAVNTLAVNFKLRTGNLSNGMIVGVLESPDNLAGFVPIDTMFCTSTGVLEDQIVYLDSYTGNGHYVAFKSYTPNSSSLYVDDVLIDLIPTCRTPQHLAAQTVLTTSIELSWTETGSATAWEIEYGAPGFTQGTGTSVQATSNPFTVTGLTSGTDYEFYVRAVCSTTDMSDWTTKLTTSTLCDVLVVTPTTPFTENFDNTTTALPTCWANTYDIGTTDWQVAIPSHGTVTSAHSGSKVVEFYHDGRGNESSLQLPTMDITALTTPTLTFWYTNEDWSGDQNTLEVYYRTTPTGTWTLLATHSSGVDTWTLDSLSLPSPSATYQIKFKGISDYGYSINIDDVTVSDGGTTPSITAPTVTTAAANDITQTAATLHGTVTAGSETITAQGFEWKETNGGTYTQVSATGTTISHNLTGLTPNTGYTFRAFATTASGTTYGAELTFTTLQQGQETCPSPTNVAATDITENSAVISWTQPDNAATSWDVLYKESAASAWNTATTSNNPYTLTGLSAQTSYDVQIIAHCTNGQTSDPSATYTFSTREVGITDYEMATSLYPNPNNGLFTITNTRYNMDNVKVYDAYGKLLKNVEVNGNSAVIDVTDLAAGVYFVRVNTEKGIVTKRVVKN